MILLLFIFSLSDSFNISFYGSWLFSSKWNVICKEGNYLFSNLEGGIWVFDVANPNEPRIVHIYSTKTFSFHNMIKKDTLIYWLGSNKRRNTYPILKILSCANPESIYEISSYSPYINGMYYRCGTIKDSLLFVGGLRDLGASSSCDSLYILNIKDINNVREISKIGDITYPIRIITLNNLLFICEKPWGFSIVDISEPTLPRIINRWRGRGGDCKDITFKDSFAFVGCGCTLRVFNISKPESIYEVSKIYLPVSQEEEPDISRLLRKGDTLIIAISSEIVGLYFLDISNPISPQIISSVDFYVGAKDLILENNLLYCAGGCLNIFDISNLHSIIHIKRIELPFYSENVEYYGNFVIMDDMSMAIKILDISDANNIKMKHNFHTLFPFLKDYCASGIKVIDTLLFAGFWTPILYIFNIKDMDSISLVGICSLSNIGGNPRDFFLRDSLLFVDMDWRGLVILNISRLDSISILGVSEPLSVTNSRSMAIGGNYAYLVQVEAWPLPDGVTIFDISDPTNIRKIGGIPIDNTARDIDIKDDTILFLCNYEDGLRIFNVKNPYNPIEITRYQPPIPWAQAIDIDVKDDLAVVSFGYTGGVKILDVSEPRNPQEVGYYFLLLPNAVCYDPDKKLIHIAEYWGGYYALRYYSAEIKEKKDEKILKEVLVFKGNKIYLGDDYKTILKADLYNILGGKIKSFEILSPYIDLENIPNGIYFLEIKKKEKKYRRQFIKIFAK